MLQTAKLLSKLILSMKLENELSFANVVDSTEDAQSDNEQDSDFEEEKKAAPWPVVVSVVHLAW